MMDWLDDLWDRLTDALVQVVRLRNVFALFTGHRITIVVVGIVIIGIVLILMTRR